MSRGLANIDIRVYRYDILDVKLKTKDLRDLLAVSKEKNGIPRAGLMTLIAAAGRQSRRPPTFISLPRPHAASAIRGIYIRVDAD